MNTPPRAPDILWVVTTQWRAQAAGYAGDPNARTPFLDALAARAVDYRQAVTPHPFGPFARAAMLTGVPSPENGVRDYFDPLPSAARTIAHLMADRGYETAWFGKWHLGRRDPSAPLVGEAHARTIVPESERGGFEFWEGFESGFLLNDPLLHGTRLPWPERFRGYQADVLCERVAAWWKHGPKAVRRPRFCVVSLETPHPPYDAPAGGIAPMQPEAVRLAANVPAGGEAEGRARRELAGYYAHVEATDRAIGRLAKALGPQVFLLITSVHGDMHGAHGLFRKGWPYEESIRVPLLVSGPGLAPRVSDESVSLIDLPRLTTGLVDAHSLPAIERAAAEISMPSVVRLPHQCDCIWSGTRTKAEKRIFNTDGTLWLHFDLENDPGEMRNLTV